MPRTGYRIHVSRRSTSYLRCHVDVTGEDCHLSDHSSFETFSVDAFSFLSPVRHCHSIVHLGDRVVPLSDRFDCSDRGDPALIKRWALIDVRVRTVNWDRANAFLIGLT